jgi:hypothetical protein
MTNDKPVATPDWLKARTLLPSIMAAITLAVFGLINATGLFFGVWNGGYGVSILVVFCFGGCAYLLGLGIERMRRGKAG